MIETSVRWAARGAIVVAATATLAACGPKKAEDVPIGKKIHIPRDVPPVPAPPVKEKLDAAEKRIAAAMSASGCSAVYALAPLTTKATREALCVHEKQVAGAPVAASGSYGDQGAVIDYAVKPKGKGPKAKTRITTAVLARDSDGLYHLAFVYGAGGPTASTKVDTAELKSSVGSVTSALRKRNCDAFAKVIFTGFGPGKTGSKSDICNSLRGSPLPAMLAAFPKLTPKIYGGNGQVGFFGLDTTIGHFSVIMARPPKDKGVESTTGPYQFVRAILTNPPAGK